MKKFSILLLSLIATLISCKKTDTGLLNKDKVVGSWLLKQYAGGLAYRVIIPTDSIAITFQKSGKYTLSTNDTIPGMVILALLRHPITSAEVKL